MRKHFIKDAEISVYKRAGIVIHYDKPYVMLPGAEKSNGIRTVQRGKHLQLTGVAIRWRNASSMTAERFRTLLEIMEEDPTKVILRTDLVDRLVKKKEGNIATMQAFIGDMIKRDLIRYVGE